MSPLYRTYILCCPIGTNDALGRAGLPPAIVTGDWMATNGDYISWGAAVDWCVAQGGTDLCPYDVYCPNG